MPIITAENWRDFSKSVSETFLLSLPQYSSAKAQVSIAGYSLKSTGSIFIILPLPSRLFLVYYGATLLHKTVFTKKVLQKGVRSNNLTVLKKEKQGEKKRGEKGKGYRDKNSYHTG